MDDHPQKTSIDTRPTPVKLDIGLPAIVPAGQPQLDLQLARWLALDGYPRHALGRAEELVKQLARIQCVEGQAFGGISLERPQLVVFAADHGIVDEGVSAFGQEVSRQRVDEVLRGSAVVNTLARLHGFELTVVDAGLAQRLDAPTGADERVTLLARKIGHGTRNMVLSPAMPLRQAIAALQAGMDVVRHLPGRVVALGDIGVGSTACASLLLSRLCGVPLADACGRDPGPGDGQDSLRHQRRLEKLQLAAARHRKAVTPLEALAAMGGFEIAMQAGAMLQAASERRIVLVDGFVSGAAALVARGLRPAVADYLVFGHRSTEPGHRLLLIHMQAQPLLDMALRVGQGAGALMAWPLLLAAQAMLTGRMAQD
jgi:nicotinate-nucleotide--dimethylbenzimidazole phosphoribosyltransferase